MNLHITPIVTEKSTLASTLGKYQFSVPAAATKVQVKMQLEQMYGKKVAKVNAVNVRRKTRQVGRGKTFTKRQATKKVIVTFVGKEAIDINKTK